MFTNILVAFDGSDHAEKAVDIAGDLAAKYDARLCVLTVMESGELPKALRRYAESEHIEGSDMRVHTMIAERIVEKGKAIAAGRGVKQVAGAVRVGDVAGQILGHASKEKADLIVLGSRGLSDFESLMLGSVSHKVTNMAACTVIAVR